MSVIGAMRRVHEPERGESTRPVLALVPGFVAYRYADATADIQTMSFELVAVGRDPVLLPFGRTFAELRLEVFGRRYLLRQARVVLRRDLPGGTSDVVVFDEVVDLPPGPGYEPAHLVFVPGTCTD